MITLTSLQPNPHRDFDLDPLDPEKIGQLVASIDSLDFWGGIVVRKLKDATVTPAGQRAAWKAAGFDVDTPSHYQLAFGHHRAAALLKAGKGLKADINVIEYDDMMMAKALGMENATQRKGIGAVTDAVLAATRVLSYGLLSGGDVSDLLQNFEEGSKHSASLKSLQGRLLAGEGIGQPLIVKFFDGAISVGDVNAAIKTLKLNGKLAKVLAETQARIAAEQAEAEAAARALAEKAEARRLAAEKAQAEAKKAEEAARKAQEAADNAAAAKRQAALDRATAAAAAARSAKKAASDAARSHNAAEKQVEVAVEAGKVKAGQVEKAKQAATKALEKASAKPLDPKVASLFRSHPTSVWDTVMNVLTSERGQDFIPVDKQFSVVKGALDYMARMVAEQSKGGEVSIWTKRRFDVTAENVARVLNGYMTAGRRFVDEQMPEKAKKEETLKNAAERFMQGVSQCNHAMAALTDYIAEGGNMPLAGGNGIFFKSTLPEFIKQLEAFAKAHAKAASIINHD
jgi:hypothetical protein